MTTATLNQKISSIFASVFRAHPERQTDPALALQVAREAASAMIPAGVTGDFNDETLTFAADE